MAELRAYIKANGVEKLKNEYKIQTNRSKMFPNLVLFKYSQLNSPFNEDVVKQSRGTILDEENDWNIVSFPYEKFFNYGEGQAQTIDWSQPVTVTEKTDGSLVILYFYKGEWRISTSGLPDGSGKVFLSTVNRLAEALNEDEEEEDNDNKKDDGGEFTTFSDLFWRIWKEKNYKIPDESDNNKCFMLELATPLNRVVVAYKENYLYLHGVRNLTTLKEERPEIYTQKYNWDLVPRFDFNNMEEVLEASKTMNAINKEGFVVCDVHFNRVKVKAPMYIQLSLLSNKDVHGLNATRLLSIIQINEGDEFLAYFPQFKGQYEKVKLRYSALVDYSQNISNELEKNNYDAREFATKVSQKYPEIFQCLFSIRKSKIAGNDVTVKDYYSKLTTKRLMEMIKKYELMLQNNST